MCVIIVLGALPELLAGVLTAACILTPFYTLKPEAPTMTETLVMEERDGALYVVNAPLPERILISRELWDMIQPADVPGPDWAYAEEIQHADPNRANDGYVLHIDAENVTCSYRIAAVPEAGDLTGVLAAWSEQ